MATRKTQSVRLAELEDRIEDLEDQLAQSYQQHDHDHDADAPLVCSLPVMPERDFDDGVSPDREHAILSTGDKWVNGTHLHYYMFSDGHFGGSTAERDVVRDAFQMWKDVGIGLDFTEVTDIADAELRIGFLRNNGSWSYIGTVALRVGQNERTMNFGWDITQSGPNGLDTAIHEIGHALGLKHEHQNPNAGIVWNRQAVYDYFRAYPGAALGRGENRQQHPQHARPVFGRRVELGSGFDHALFLCLRPDRPANALPQRPGPGAWPVGQGQGRDPPLLPADQRLDRAAAAQTVPIRAAGADARRTEGLRGDPGSFA